jgi:hypothetical protein
MDTGSIFATTHWLQRITLTITILLHLQIIGLVFAPLTSLSKAAWTLELIVQHHETLNQLCEGGMTPKIHYNIHISVDG